MRWSGAVLAATAAVAFAAAGCKSYETQGSAQVVAEDKTPVVQDPVYRNSSGVHGEENTLDDRMGVSNASGPRRARSDPSRQ